MESNKGISRKIGHLIVSRKLGESVLIGEDIEVIVVTVDRRKVGLRIVAPQEVTIMRSELLPIKEVS